MPRVLLGLSVAHVCILLPPPPHLRTNPFYYICVNFALGIVSSALTTLRCQTFRRTGSVFGLFWVWSRKSFALWPECVITSGVFDACIVFPGFCVLYRVEMCMCKTTVWTSLHTLAVVISRFCMAMVARECYWLIYIKCKVYSTI